MTNPGAGYYWQMKKKEKLMRERDAFNRHQTEDVQKDAGYQEFVRNINEHFLEKNNRQNEFKQAGKLSGEDVIHKSNIIKGEVRGIQREMVRADQKNSIVITFRVERYDGSGNRLQPVPVQMQGFSFKGVLHEGDLIEIKAKKKGQQIVRTNKLFNITSDSKFIAKKHRIKGFLYVLSVIVGSLPFLALVIFIISILYKIL